MNKLFLFSILLPSFLMGYEKPSILSFGVGIFDIQRQRYRTAEFRMEYKFSAEYALFRPMLGIMCTAQSSLYVYGGFGIDWVIQDHLLFSPNFAIGYYNKGNGKNLHFPLEFRSGIEIGWVYCNQSRLGIHFYHISNASLGTRNPGEESLVLFYAIPL